MFGEGGVGCLLATELSFSGTQSLPLPLTSRLEFCLFHVRSRAVENPKLTAELHGGCPQIRGPSTQQCGLPSRDPALRPRTNLTRSVIQEPTTTTAAATFSCQGLPGSPDAAITKPCSSSTPTLPFALCLNPLPETPLLPP